jgi:hypothetical protein
MVNDSFKGKLAEIQEVYTCNYKLSSARMVVENSFGRLKARFRRLLKRFDGQLPFLLDVIADCVILNNICEINKDICIEEWFDYEVTTDVENTRAMCGNFDGQIDDAKNIGKVIAEYPFQWTFEASKLSIILMKCSFSWTLLYVLMIEI